MKSFIHLLSATAIVAIFSCSSPDNGPVVALSSADALVFNPSGLRSAFGRALHSAYPAMAAVWFSASAADETDAPSDESAPALNTLSEAERAGGWQLLFDGKTTKGWHSFNKTSAGAGWKVRDGVLGLEKSNPDEAAGDLVTDEEFQNFDLRLEWKISDCGNSGLMYNVVEGEKYCCPYVTGPELQVLDNACHPDAKIPMHRAGDLYDMISVKQETVKPAGEWNKVRLRVRNGKVEEWLNGKKVIEFQMFTPQWKEMIAGSKFKAMPDFGTFNKGKICVQDHGDKVWFRNIKIKRIS